MIDDKIKGTDTTSDARGNVQMPLAPLPRSCRRLSSKNGPIVVRKERFSAHL